MSAKVIYNSRFKEANRAMEKGFELGIEAAAIAVESQAVKLAPWDTSRLRGSITYGLNDGTKSTGRPVANSEASDTLQTTPGNKFEAWVGTNVVYAAAQEYLHKSYLRKALIVMKQKIGRIVSGQISKKLDFK